MTMHPATSREQRSSAAFARGAAWRLCLAASPTFAFMALVSAVSGGPAMGCMAGPDASPLTGMALMYLLMSAFHLAPWLRLVSSGPRPAG